MKLGVCGSPDIAAPAHQAGFDFFEGSVQAMLQPMAPRETFLKALEAVKASPLPCPVCNMFLPGTLNVVGTAIDTAAVEAYVATACERAAEAGVDTIVFGSGGARKVPEGFDKDQAHAQLRDFLLLTAPYAAKNGVTIAVEPLRFAECNIYNTVSECAAAVREVNRPSIRLLVDGYHWAHNDEPAADIEAAAPLFRHMHVATQPNRLAPGAEPCSRLPLFLDTVRRIGYQGRMSVEGKISPEHLPEAARLLRAMEN